MSDVVMYSTGYCPYCVRAKMLLKQKNVEFTDIRVDVESDRRDEMVQRSGRTSVPQIFINDFHVGGCDDLFALEQAGELDNKLGLA
ncbi:MAG: glutaredoxin 3 [Gammaproteobacteria bacterium]|jgi:glutaredoxin 3